MAGDSSKPRCDRPPLLHQSLGIGRLAKLDQVAQHTIAHPTGLGQFGPPVSTIAANAPHRRPLAWFRQAEPGQPIYACRAWMETASEVRRIGCRHVGRVGYEERHGSTAISAMPLASRPCSTQWLPMQSLVRSSGSPWRPTAKGLRCTPADLRRVDNRRVQLVVCDRSNAGVDFP